MLKSVLFALLIFISPTEKKEIKVVALGDSITRCFWKDCWTDTASKNSRYKIINKGIGGETLHQMRMRIERDVIAQKPDICIVMGGTNDVFYKNFDEKKSMNEIHAMAKILSSHRIHIVIGVPLTLLNPKYEQRIQKLRTLIHVSNYPLIRFNEDFVLDVDHLKEILPDGVHPNKKGKDIMAKRVVEELDNILGE